MTRSRRPRGPLSAFAAAWLSLACLVMVSISSAARGGIGPENTIVVVNSGSWASLTVANYFIRLRQIPASNVVYLDWPKGLDQTDGENFRKSILVPVYQAIQTRRLTSQIDAVVYSADLPTAIDITKDLGNQTLPQPFTPVASINGMTFYSDQVIAGDGAFLQLNSNKYFRPASGGAAPASQGFRHWYGWNENNELQEAGGRHYLLSAVLAITTGRGNSVSEAVRVLTTSAPADGTSPTGTIYFARNDDIRSKVRHDDFAAAVAAIEQAGVKAAIVEGELPRGKPDVQGLMAGTALAEWGRSKSTIRPGALCEHFTSFGGVMTEDASQTPLTEFLRYGAAGASGTVTEPYAVKEKFPSPFVQLHYVRGCTLLESFYQSVSGAYQLLIVGDPLCRPWAKIPQVTVDGVQPGAVVKGPLTLTPQAKTTGPAVDRFELFVDGLRLSNCAAGEALPLDTTTMLDGYHELRVVGIEGSDIETQGRAVLPIWVDNNGRRIEVTAAEKTVAWGQKLVLTAKSPDAVGIAVYFNSKLAGSLKGAEGTIEIDPQTLGLGPVALRAIGLGKTAREHVLAAPLVISVTAGDPLPGQAIEGRTQGLMFQQAGGRPTVVTDMKDREWLLKAGGSADKAFTLSGYVDVPANEVRQFHLRHDGRIKLTVDDRVLYDGKSDDRDRVLVLPVNLGKGSHRLLVEGVPDPQVHMELKFGGPGVRSLQGRQFWHQAAR